MDVQTNCVDICGCICELSMAHEVMTNSILQTPNDELHPNRSILQNIEHASAGHTIFNSTLATCEPHVSLMDDMQCACAPPAAPK